MFMKATTCLTGPDDGIIQPIGSTKLDYEVELAIVIGRETRHVAESDALKHVAGYCSFNDVSERAFQIERGGQWDKGKGCDSFGPLGPWLVTRDEVPDPQALPLWLELNGQRMQDSSTADMIFGCAHIVSYVSQLHDPAARRRDLHRHAAGRRHGQRQLPAGPATACASPSRASANSTRPSSPPAETGPRVGADDTAILRIESPSAPR
jgi:hypothetical protein